MNDLNESSEIDDQHSADDRHDALDRDKLDGAVPEADLLEQERPVLDDDIDPEAPSQGNESVRTTIDADDADLLEQSRDVPDDDDDRGDPE